MSLKIILNPCVSYKKKGGVYVFYIDFNFFFFKAGAADLVEEVLIAISGDNDFSRIPNDFLEYLVSKNIIREVKNA